MRGLGRLDALHGEFSRQLLRCLLGAHGFDGFALAIRIQLGSSCRDSRGLDRLRSTCLQILRKQFFLYGDLRRRGTTFLVIIGHVEPIPACAALDGSRVTGHAVRTGLIVNTHGART